MSDLKNEIHDYWTNRARVIQNIISRKWQMRDGRCGETSF